MEEARKNAFGQRLHSTGLEMFVEEAYEILDLEVEGAISGYLAFDYDRTPKKTEEAVMVVEGADIKVKMEIENLNKGW